MESFHKGCGCRATLLQPTRCGAAAGPHGAALPRVPRGGAAAGPTGRRCRISLHACPRRCASADLRSGKSYRAATTRTLLHILLTSLAAGRGIEPLPAAASAYCCSSPTSCETCGCRKVMICRRAFALRLKPAGKSRCSSMFSRRSRQTCRKIITNRHASSADKENLSENHDQLAQ